MKSIKCKNRLYKTWIQKCNILFKNKLTAIITFAEKPYYKRCFDDAIGNIKQTWKILKSIIGKQTTNKIKEISVNDTGYWNSVNIGFMKWYCERLHSRGLKVKCGTTIYKGKGDPMDSGSYRGILWLTVYVALFVNILQSINHEIFRVD